MPWEKFFMLQPNVASLTSQGAVARVMTQKTPYTKLNKRPKTIKALQKTKYRPTIAQLHRWYCPITALNQSLTAAQRSTLGPRRKPINGPQPTHVGPISKSSTAQYKPITAQWRSPPEPQCQSYGPISKAINGPLPKPKSGLVSANYRPILSPTTAHKQSPILAQYRPITAQYKLITAQFESPTTAQLQPMTAH